MGLGNFIKNGGLFGKMRGFDSNREGHWYGFDEYTEDVTKLGNAVTKTAEIPNEARKTLGIENRKKTKLIGNKKDTLKIEQM